MPVLFQKSGFDFFILDTEHGSFDHAALSGIIMNARLCGLPVIIRLPDNQRRDIIRLLDLGADGLLLPMTNNRQDIQHVVEYAHYAPLGKRGISTTRAHTFYSPPDLSQYMADANRRTMVFAQIETREGLENIADILAIEGVSGALLGPNDLACDLGCIGDDEPILNAINKLADACCSSGKLSGVITSREIYLNAAIRKGLRLLCIGSELNHLKNACQQIVRQWTETCH
jgi:2-keto-3-deoxy-L-rhamnonate aldolase RhmA